MREVRYRARRGDAIDGRDARYRVAAVKSFTRGVQRFEAIRAVSVDEHGTETWACVHVYASDDRLILPGDEIWWAWGSPGWYVAARAYWTPADGSGRNVRLSVWDETSYNSAHDDATCPHWREGGSS